MHLSYLILNIHWIPVIVMTIVSFALGALWHQKFLFGKYEPLRTFVIFHEAFNFTVQFMGNLYQLTKTQVH